MGIRKGHINGLGTLFNDYLMCWDLLEGIGIGCYTGGDVYQVTILIILDIQEIITFVVATEVAAGALVANNDPGHSRSHLRGILVGGIGIHCQQVINTICLRHIHSDGVGICTVVIQLGNFFPITAIQFDLQVLAAVHGNKVLRSCGSAPLLGLDSNAAAALCYFVNIFIKGCKVAVVVKTPVGEHSHIDGITIRQQDVVGGRTPAGTHVGVAVIAVVHQIAIMTPELVHKDAGSAAGIHKRLVVSAVIGQIATHVEDIVLLGIFQHTRGTNTALFLR